MDSYLLIILILIFTFLLVFVCTVPWRLRHAARAAGINIKIKSLLGMRLRKTPPSAIVNPIIKAAKEGIILSPTMVENFYLMGGHVDRVVDALIAAKKTGVTLDFIRASAFDIAGRDIQECFEMNSMPKAETNE